jgi:putative colanic acid biosynthesis UDP-glucose lipid carrier transferase
MSSKGEAAVMDNATAKNTSLPTVRDFIADDLHGNGAYYYTATRTKFETLSEKTYTGKRFIDLLIGTFGFFAFLLTYPIIALGIKWSSKGPVIFKQERTGQNGQRFTCYKFRTMHQLNLRRIDGKPVVTQKGDKRIFGFGSFLRKTNLDELPQILNVLKGDMSLVGPRPYPVDECAHWNNTFDDFYYRYAVKPGITGYAQILGYRGGTLDEEHMRTRLDKDLVYVQKQAPLFDIKIIFGTVTQMFKMETNAH